MSRSRALVLGLALAGLATAALGNVPAQGPGYRLAVEGGRVSLHAEGVPLSRVVQDLGARVGFEVIADVPPSELVHTKLENVSVEQVLRKICRSVGYLEVRDATGTQIKKLILTPSSVKATRTASRQSDPAGWRPPEPPPPIEEPPPVVEEAPPEPPPQEVQEPPPVDEQPADDGNIFNRPRRPRKDDN